MFKWLSEERDREKKTRINKCTGQGNIYYVLNGCSEKSKNEDSL